MSNQIELYKKVSIEMLEEAGVEIDFPILSYQNDSGDLIDYVYEDEERIILMNEIDPLWTPSHHNLRIEQSIKIENPSVFFGSNGVTAEGNTIGFSAHIYSQASSFQRTISFGTIEASDSSSVIKFNFDFNPGMLRGSLRIDFFMYVKELRLKQLFQAPMQGMKLNSCSLGDMTIFIDGDGSVFPITEFENPNGPLWKFERNWIEPQIDTFDITNVNLMLNTAHPLFSQLKEGRTRVSKRFMGEIIVQSMAMIIHEILFVENIDEETFSGAEPNSILAAVDYWIKTFEVDTSSMYSVSNSLREFWEEKLL